MTNTNKKYYDLSNIPDVNLNDKLNKLNKKILKLSAHKSRNIYFVKWYDKYLYKTLQKNLKKEKYNNIFLKYCDIKKNKNNDFYYLNPHRKNKIPNQHLLNIFTIYNNNINDKYVKYRNDFKKIYNCHSYLEYYAYPEINRVKLNKAYHCDKALLCPLCAVRRAVKKLHVYFDKTNQLLIKRPKTKIYLVTFTIKNDKDLLKSYNHLISSVKRILQRRNEAIKAKKGIKKYNYALNSMFANSYAGVYSCEVKRGKKSKLWHPHIHLLLLNDDEKIDYNNAIKEWKEITKDSTNIHFNLYNFNDKISVPPEKFKDHSNFNKIKFFLEVFKYAFKFSDMSFNDNLMAYDILKGKRLMNSFGEFRGLDNIEPDESEYDLYEYYRLFYRFDYDNLRYREYNITQKYDDSGEDIKRNIESINIDINDIKPENFSKFNNDNIDNYQLL